MMKEFKGKSKREARNQRLGRTMKSLAVTAAATIGLITVGIQPAAAQVVPLTIPQHKFQVVSKVANGQFYTVDWVIPASTQYYDNATYDGLLSATTASGYVFCYVSGGCSSTFFTTSGSCSTTTTTTDTFTSIGGETTISSRAEFPGPFTASGSTTYIYQRGTQEQKGVSIRVCNGTQTYGIICKIPYGYYGYITMKPTYKKFYLPASWTKKVYSASTGAFLSQTTGKQTLARKVALNIQYGCQQTKI